MLIMSDGNSVYWDDLAEELKDPEFLRRFVLESIRIDTIDSIVNQLEDARATTGLSKADLARAISVEPATVRRLLSSASRSNPTLGTLSDLAAALGYRITLEQLGKSAESVAKALQNGTTDDARELAAAIHELI